MKYEGRLQRTSWRKQELGISVNCKIKIKMNYTPHDSLAKHATLLAFMMDMIK